MSESWFKALRNKMEGISAADRKAIEALDAKEDAAEKKRKAAASGRASKRKSTEFRDDIEEEM